ncbi:MAG: hypothetical protein HY908_10300 [Myxococcales bacterium]|nr:hypothetical protein [Myxococcales bacterium]
MDTQLTCAELLAHAEERKLTVRLELSLGVLAIGHVDVRRGEVVHAEMPGAQGDQALALLARLPRADVRLVFLDADRLAPPSLSRPWRSHFPPVAPSPEQRRALEAAFASGQASIVAAGPAASTVSAPRAGVSDPTPLPAPTARRTGITTPTPRRPAPSDADTAPPPDFGEAPAAAAAPRSPARQRRHTPLGVPVAVPVRAAEPRMTPPSGSPTPAPRERLPGLPETARPPLDAEVPETTRSLGAPSNEPAPRAATSGSAGDPFEALFQEATLAYVRRDYEAALQGFERCAALRPDDPNVRHNIQRLRQRIGTK